MLILILRCLKIILFSLFFFLEANLFSQEKIDDYYVRSHSLGSLNDVALNAKIQLISSAIKKMRNDFLVIRNLYFSDTKKDIQFLRNQQNERDSDELHNLESKLTFLLLIVSISEINDSRSIDSRLPHGFYYELGDLLEEILLCQIPHPLYGDFEIAMIHALFTIDLSYRSQKYLPTLKKLLQIFSKDPTKESSVRVIENRISLLSQSLCQGLF